MFQKNKVCDGNALCTDGSDGLNCDALTWLEGYTICDGFNNNCDVWTWLEGYTICDGTWLEGYTICDGFTEDYHCPDTE